MIGSVSSSFADQLRTWRTARRLSQLDLSAVSGVSQRYLSFLETGRSQPSREMVVHLSDQLELPLRDRNTMLNAAGYASIYGERSLDEDSMDEVRQVLDTVLRAHPFPAYVVDGRWNLLMTNEAALAVTAAVAGPRMAEAAGGNVIRLTMHPDGLRRSVSNWPEAAGALLKRLKNEVAHRPGDKALSELLDEVLAYPGVAELSASPPRPESADLVVPITFDTPGFKGSFFTMISTIGSAFDVTLEELRLETLLPADHVSMSALEELTLRG